MSTWILAIFIWYTELDNTTAVAVRKYDGFNSLQECRQQLNKLDLRKLAELEKNAKSIEVSCLREG